MAMTAAERKRRQVERDRAASEAMPDAAYGMDLDPPFSDFFGKHRNLETLEFSLDVCGYPLPEFEDGEQKSYSGEPERDPELSPYTGFEGALGRAEVMVANLADAAVTLAGMINDYKRMQITRRLSQIDAMDLGDPDVRKKAMEEIVSLNRLLERLNKQVRVNLPQWKLRGE